MESSLRSRPRSQARCSAVARGFSLFAALLLALSITAPARAAPITYTLSPDASASFLGGTANFAGTFTYDPTTSIVSSAEITVTSFPPWNGLYQDDPFVSVDGNSLRVFRLAISALVFLNFAAPLGSTPDPLVGAVFSGSTSFIQLTSGTGAAIPSSSVVSEPSSILFILGLLVVFTFCRRRTMTDGRRPASLATAVSR